MSTRTQKYSSTTVNSKDMVYNQFWISFINITTYTFGSECPIGWINWGPNCYYLSEQKLDWLSSQEYCLSLGGHLVEFSYLEEENPLDAFLSQDVLDWSDRCWSGRNLEMGGRWSNAYLDKLGFIRAKWWRIPEL